VFLYACGQFATKEVTGKPPIGAAVPAE
jgi:hypothetical protein